VRIPEWLELTLGVMGLFALIASGVLGVVAVIAYQLWPRKEAA
jgi:hypothetical protein